MRQSKNRERLFGAMSISRQHTAETRSNNCQQWRVHSKLIRNAIAINQHATNQRTMSSVASQEHLPQLMIPLRMPIATA